MIKFVSCGLRGEPLTVYGDGTQTRDFVNVKDVVEAVLKALSFKCSKTEVFGMCSGTSISINALARYVCRFWGRTLRSCMLLLEKVMFFIVTETRRRLGKSWGSMHRSILKMDSIGFWLAPTEVQGF